MTADWPCPRRRRRMQRTRSLRPPAHQPASCLPTTDRHNALARTPGPEVPAQQVRQARPPVRMPPCRGGPLRATGGFRVRFLGRGRGVVRARTRTTAREPAVRTRAVGSVKPWSVARARASAVVAGRARSVARRSARTPRGRKPPASGSVKPTRPPGRSARSQSASAAAAQEVQRGGAQDQVEAVVGHRQRHGRCHPPVDRAGQAEPGRPRTACGDHAGRQVNGQDGHGGRLVVVRVVIAGGQLIELLRHPSVRPRRSHRRSIARTRCPTAASFGRAIRGESESTS